MPQNIHALQYHLAEWPFVSAKAYEDPFNEIELDVIITGPDGREWHVPAFWSGGQEWRARFCGRTPGAYRWRTECTDSANDSLHGVEGVLQIAACEPPNALLAHGPVRVSDDRRYFVHDDGTPFFWLADTWWMGLCRRLHWPDQFQTLTADRVGKGFSVVQIVAGLYPDMPAFDARGANEAGFPWETDYTQINPAYFDMADVRIAWLVRSGLVPCIVGFWSYFIPWMGEAKVQQHWRNLVARYGAYPVVWCLGGE